MNISRASRETSYSFQFLVLHLVMNRHSFKDHCFACALLGRAPFLSESGCKGTAFF